VQADVNQSGIEPDQHGELVPALGKVTVHELARRPGAGY
jgi:hypothetical protein